MLTSSSLKKPAPQGPWSCTTPTSSRRPLIISRSSPSRDQRSKSRDYARLTCIAPCHSARSEIDSPYLGDRSRPTSCGVSTRTMTVKVLCRGYGGIQKMHELTGLSRPTILRGMSELRQQQPVDLTEVPRPSEARLGPQVRASISGCSDVPRANVHSECPANGNKPPR